MEQCADCGICQRACPTGCIPEDGTVVDASRCLTEANENEGAWPPWVPADSHNCLVGCMLCQKPCPADRMHRDHHIEIVAEFDRDETALILEGLERGSLPEGLRMKLASLDLDEYSTVLGRNLAALRDSALARRQD